MGILDFLLNELDERTRVRPEDPGSLLNLAPPLNPLTRPAAARTAWELGPAVVRTLAGTFIAPTFEADRERRITPEDIARWAVLSA